MSPAVKRAIEALRKAQRHLGSYSAPPELVEYLAEALAGLEAEAAAELRRPAAAEVEETIAELTAPCWQLGRVVPVLTAERAAALLRRLSPSPTEEWRPIEKAPQTGEFIWAYLYDTGIRQVRWMTPEECAEIEGGAAADYNGSWVEADDREDWSPKFWLPIDALPAPPSLPTDKT